MKNVSIKMSTLLITGIIVVFSIACQVNSIKQNKSENYSLADSLAYANYKNYCAGCHGGNLEEFIGKKWEYISESNPMTGFIRNGQADIGMPAFEKTFSEQETQQLAEFLLKINKGELEPLIINEEIYQEPVNTNYYVETVVTGLEIPWGIEFLENGDMLIAEKRGVLYRFTTKKELIEIKGLPEIWQNGQGGLLDLKLHPDYRQNGWIYIAYCYPSKEIKGAGNTAIMRAKLTGNQLSQTEVLYKGIPATTKGYHFGCRIEFDRNGLMYFSIGDRGEQDNAQKTDNSNGKIHRLTDDGKIPADNPFVSNPKALASIFSYGHRNPQGLAMNPVTGEIWTHEHGPRGGDEINIVRAGLNYGWPVITFGINYDGSIITKDTAKQGMEQPVLYYVPSIAPSGMAFVTGDKYPDWQNNLLIGSLRFHYVERCVIKQHKVISREKLLENIGRVRTIKQSPDGYIYVTVEDPGRVLKIVPVVQTSK